MNSKAFRSTEVPHASGAHRTGASNRIVIEPEGGWLTFDLREVWRYRELLYFLTWRDLKVRYKQTILGATWVVIQPVLTMAIFAFIFGRVAHLPSEGVPYPIFVYAALLPWTYFAYVLQQSGNSLVSNANMISKVYFPRLILPLSPALAGLVDFGIALAVYLIMLPIFRVRPGAGIVFLPLFLLLVMATALSVGLWLSALNVAYRDVRHMLPFLTQIWLYVSPVAYSASLIHGKLAVIYTLNPMTGIIEGFRWALLGVGSPPGLSLIPSTVITLLLLLSGMIYFQRMEQTFADVV